MKRILPLLFLALLATFLTSPLYAQHGFDVKKRANRSVNTSSLNAVHINGASGVAGRKAAVTPSVTKHIKTFPAAVVQKGKQKVFYSTETGLPSFITTPARQDGARLSVKADVSVAARDYLVELKPILQLEKPEGDFTVQRISRDKNSKTHVRMNQFYKGIPVYGGEVVIHLNEFGEGESFNGIYYKIKEDIDPIPTLSKQSAIDKVNAHLGGKRVLHTLSSRETELVQYQTPQATLVVYRDKGLVQSNVLAYHIISCPSVRERWEYFIDASTGAVLHSFESTCAADGPRTTTSNDINEISRTIHTYQVGTSYYLVDASRPMFKATGSVLPDEPIGGILTIDMNNTFGDNQAVQHVVSPDNTWATANRKKAITAHFNAGAAYEYYLNNHGRNSIDGDGGTIISIVNMPDEDGKALDNAFWNGKAMFYGNGNTAFKPLAGGMDVAGHEMTHGVIQSTANLEYQGESGAINESIADMFGAMMDPTDWTIGEDVVKTTVFPSGALRSLSDPHNGGSSLASPGYQPRHTNEKYTGTEDNGGVHVNSGITNFAFYKFATATTQKKAADVFYKALKDYLTKSSKFIDLRLAVIKAAGDLFGAGSAEVTQAGLAFDAVGITNGQGGDYEETLPDNPGTEFLLVYNTAADNDNTLYRSTLALATTPLTTTEFLSRPSVTDNGEIAVFVAADQTIHAIKTAPGTDPGETVLSTETIWSNVVVSKDGSKIAAVTAEQSPTIHVYDFEQAQWGTFELYNPTYTEGVNSAGPVYADALEFDYSGQFLVYDCFNRIENADGGPDIEYWDVNFIQVWDNTAKDFADGTIEKLFSSLPDGVSIGNPSFSKTSPNILAFDYVDENEPEGSDEKYAVLGCNVETNDVNAIVSNNSLGWPSFNKTDSQLAYTAINELDDEYEIDLIHLSADKISADGLPEGAFASAKWPVFFATGDRVIDDGDDDEVTGVLDEVDKNVSMSCYPNPFTSEVSVMLKEPLLPGSRIVVSDLIGRQVYEYTPTGGTETLPLNLERLNPGYYIMKISNAKKTGSCKIVKR